MRITFTKTNVLYENKPHYDVECDGVPRLTLWANKGFIRIWPSHHDWDAYMAWQRCWNGRTNVVVGDEVHHGDSSGGGHTFGGNLNDGKRIVRAMIAEFLEEQDA